MYHTYIQRIIRFLKTDSYVIKVENKKWMTAVLLKTDSYVKNYCKENTEIRQEMDDQFFENRFIRAKYQKERKQ